MGSGRGGLIEVMKRAGLTALFAAAMGGSLVSSLAPSALCAADILTPCLLLSAFHMRTSEWSRHASLLHFPLLSLLRSLTIFCAYSLCGLPSFSYGHYLGTTAFCGLVSVVVLIMKASVFTLSSGSSHLHLKKENWGELSSLFVSSMFLAFSHIVVAYRVRCQARRKNFHYSSDLESVLSYKVSSPQKFVGSSQMHSSVGDDAMDVPAVTLAEADSLFMPYQGILVLHYKITQGAFTCLLNEIHPSTVLSNRVSQVESNLNNYTNNVDLNNYTNYANLNNTNNTNHDNLNNTNYSNLNNTNNTNYFSLNNTYYANLNNTNNTNYSNLNNTNYADLNITSYSNLNNHTNNAHLSAPLLSSNYGLLSHSCISEKRQVGHNNDAIEVGEREIGKLGGDKKKGIVFIHGFGGGVYSWRHVMHPLAKQAGCFVAAFDRPGWGLTSRPTRSDWERKGNNPYELSTQVDLLFAFCRELGLESVILVGHDDGGLLALMASAKSRTHSNISVEVEGVVLIGASLSREVVPTFVRVLLHASLGNHMMRPLLRSEIGHVSSRRAWHNSSKLTPHVLDLYKAPLRVEGWDKALVEICKGSIISTTQIMEVLKLLHDLPTLLVSGAYDVLAPLSSAQLLSAQLPCSTLVTIPDCGHLPHEESPEALLAFLLPFISCLSSENKTK